MRSIVLLPLDGSDKDRRAITVAAAIAELASAGVRVVRVLETPADRPSGSDGNVAHASREDQDDGLRDVARQIDELTQSPTTWEILDSSDVAGALLHDIEVHGARFVVMATQAPRAVDRAIHGSVAGRLLRESPQPVVLVPPGSDHLGGKRLQLRRVLVPIDGSAASLGVITHLLMLSRARVLQCVLIHAVDPRHVAAPLAETALNEVAEQLRRLGATVEVRIVESDDPGAVILDAVRNDLVELIAMTTRGASGIKRLLLGSVAEVVVRGSEIPVMLVTR